MKYILLISFVICHQFLNAQNIQSIWLQDPVVVTHKSAMESLFKNKGSKLGNALYFRVFKQTTQNPNYGELEVWAQLVNSSQFVLINSYPICYYSGGLGFKAKQGDGKTPEGFYRIYPQSLNRYSSYHRAFNLGYPNEFDRSLTRTGSLIMIHGNCVSIGCIAMGDEQIEQLWTMALAAFIGKQKHISIHIFPFHMTDTNMQANALSAYYTFWQMLQPAYNFFEAKQLVPQILVVNKKYILNPKQ